MLCELGPFSCRARQGAFLFINSSCVQRVLFSRPSCCSVFFLVIILGRNNECLRARRMWLFARARRAECLKAWNGRAAVPVCHISFSSNHDMPHSLLRPPPIIMPQPSTFSVFLYDDILTRLYAQCPQGAGQHPYKWSSNDPHHKFRHKQIQTRTCQN